MKNSFASMLVAVLALAGCATGPGSGDGDTDSDSGTETSGNPVGPPLEECLAETSQMSCNAIGCVWQETVTVDAATCETSPGEGRCFALEGESVGQVAEPHAYHRMHGDQLEFMIYGIDCRIPLGWTECDGTTNSPAECACLCSMTQDGVLCGESLFCD